MNRGWIAAILAGCLVIVVGGLTAGGLIAASAGRDLSPAAATMVATIAGGILAAVATYIGGKDYEPPAPVVIPAVQEDATPTPVADAPPGPAPLVVTDVVAEPVVEYASGDESYGGTGTITEDVTAEFLGDDSDA